MALLTICEEKDLIPGRCVVRDLERLRLAVVMVEGEIFAFDDICPHRQGYLSEGPIEDGKLVCPLHAWRFDLRTGAMAGNELMKIRTFPVIRENGEILVNLAGC